MQSKSRRRGRRREGKGRQVSGVLVLDKPAEVTSNGALQEVKKLFRAAKAGHTGSLDPLATGVLPLCFGEATRFSQFLLEADKQYLATIRLGVTTKTGDADGEIVNVCEPEEYSEERIEEILSSFRGEIEQLPSMYSALKVAGEPLYKLARQGIEIEREKRRVHIYHLHLLERKSNELKIDVKCSKGTYIRSLAEDIGRLLGCGAHVTQLQRLQSGPFKMEDAFTVPQLKDLFAEGGVSALDACLKPCDTAVSDWPTVELTELTASYFKQGQPVLVAQAPVSGWVRVFVEQSGSSHFAGVGEVLDDGRVAPRRLLAGN